MYWVYILYSQTADRYYIGQTGDLSKRQENHRQKGSFYTSRAGDWKLVFAQDVANRTEARKLENRIKSGKSRKSILRYIQDARNKACLFEQNGE